MKPDQDFSELASQVTHYSKNASKLLADHKFEEAKSDFEEAYRISKLIRDPFTIRKCAFNLGAVYIRLSQATKGIEYLELAIPPENDEDKLTNNGDLYFNIALGYELLKDHQNAVSYFKKALKEYRHFQENDNNKMVVETLEKLARNSRYLRNYLESAEWNSELCQIYHQQGQDEKRLVTMGEQIVQLRKANEKEKCLIISDQIVSKVDEIIISPLTANMLNDVGLVLSQYEKFQEAERCYKKALSMTSALSSCDKLNSIILQNLGALYNVCAQYQNSIEYNTKAAAKYDELKNGINEGHCYANLAYAYHQIGDLDRAKEYFLLALRKAKDNGDAHAEWQVLESMASLCCNLGNYDMAIKYYTDAFKAITKDTESNTSLAEDRIQSKLFTLMKQEAEKQEAKMQQKMNAQEEQEQQIKMLKEKLQQQALINNQLQHQQQNEQHLTDSQQLLQLPNSMKKGPSLEEVQFTQVQTTKESVTEPVSNLPVTQSEPDLIQKKREHNIRKELIKRRLKVRRSGSRKEFDKVARGVYVSMGADVLDTIIQDERSVHSSDFSIDNESTSLSDSTISSLSSSNNSVDGHKSPEKKKKSILKQIKEKAQEKLKLLERKEEEATPSSPPKQRNQIKIGKRAKEDKGVLLNDSILQMDDDREQVKQLMRAHLDEDEEGNISEERLKKKKYSKKPPPSVSSSSTTSISSSSSGESTYSDTDTEKHHNNPQHKSGPPTLPMNSPPQTLVNTYENPSKDSPHYTEIEFNSSSKPGEIRKQKVEQPAYTEIDFSTKRKSLDFGPNYFYDDNIQQAIKGEQGLQSTSLSETVYETIRSPDEIGKSQRQTIDSPANSVLSQMSRAERSVDREDDSERFLYEQYIKSQQENVKIPEKEVKSKVCVIM